MNEPFPSVHDDLEVESLIYAGYIVAGDLRLAIFLDVVFLALPRNTNDRNRELADRGNADAQHIYGHFLKKGAAGTACDTSRWRLRRDTRAGGSS